VAFGLDIGSSALKVVELRRRFGRFVLTGLARRALPPSARGAADPGPAARALAEVVPTDGKRRPVWIGLTGRDLNLQVLVFDQVPDANFRQLLGFEMQQRRESAPDHFVDCVVAHRPDAVAAQYVTLVGSARAEWVEARLDLVRRAGLEPAGVVPNAAALYAVYRRTVPDPPAGVAVLLDIGADDMDLALVRGTELLFMRNVGSGARVFDEHLVGSLGKGPAEVEWLKVRHGSLGGGEGIDEQIAAELRPILRGAAGQLLGVINSSLNFARAQLQDRTLKIERLYLSGGGARLRGLPEYIRGTFKMDVEILDPFAAVDARRVEAHAPEDWRRLPSDLTCAIGLALLSAQRADLPVVSLIPDPIKRRRAARRSAVGLVVAALAALVLMGPITAAAWVERTVWDRHRGALAERLDAERRLNARMDDLERGLAETTQKSALLKQFVEPGTALLESLLRVRREVPAGLRLRGVTLVPAAARDPQEAFQAAEEPAFKPPGPMRLVIEGEVRTTVQGGPEAALEGIVRRLSVSGARAEIGAFGPSEDRPGWRVFTIEVRLEGGR
jgi:type IV pilus assembly protein PilM